VTTVMFKTDTASD